MYLCIYALVFKCMYEHIRKKVLAWLFVSTLLNFDTFTRFVHIYSYTSVHTPKRTRINQNNICRTRPSSTRSSIAHAHVASRPPTRIFYVLTKQHTTQANLSNVIREDTTWRHSDSELRRSSEKRLQQHLQSAQALAISFSPPCNKRKRTQRQTDSQSQHAWSSPNSPAPVSGHTSRQTVDIVLGELRRSF